MDVPSSIIISLLIFSPIYLSLVVPIQDVIKAVGLRCWTKQGEYINIGKKMEHSIIGDFLGLSGLLFVITYIWKTSVKEIVTIEFPNTFHFLNYSWLINIFSYLLGCCILVIILIGNVSLLYITVFPVYKLYLEYVYEDHIYSTKSSLKRILLVAKHDIDTPSPKGNEKKIGFSDLVSEKLVRKKAKISISLTNLIQGDVDREELKMNLDFLDLIGSHMHFDEKDVDREELKMNLEFFSALIGNYGYFDENIQKNSTSGKCWHIIEKLWFFIKKIMVYFCMLFTIFLMVVNIILDIKYL